MEIMRTEHSGWTDFYNLLSNYVTERGCAHGTRWGEYALKAMGFTADEIKASVADMAGKGEFCDCEILMNLGAAPGGAR